MGAGLLAAAGIDGSDRFNDCKGVSYNYRNMLQRTVKECGLLSFMKKIHNLFSWYPIS